MNEGDSAEAVPEAKEGSWLNSITIVDGGVRFASSFVYIVGEHVSAPESELELCNSTKLGVYDETKITQERKQ